MPLASGAQSRLTEFSRLSVGEALAGDISSLERLGEMADSYASETGPAARDMEWMARFAPAVAWLPALEHEIVAWAGLVARLNADFESARSLLSSSSQLLEAFEGAEAAMISNGVGSSEVPPNGLASRLESSFAAVRESLSESAALERAPRPGYSVPRMRRALALLGQAEDRLLSALSLGQRLSGILSELIEIGDLARPLMSQFLGAEDESDAVTMESLAKTLADLDERLQFALAKSEGLARMVVDPEERGPLEDRLEYLGEFLRALLIVNGATMLTLQAVQPSIEAAQATNAGLFGSSGSLIGILASVNDHEQEISEARGLLSEAQRALRRLNSEPSRGYQLSGLDDLLEVTGLLNDGLQLVADVAPIGPALLGGDLPRRYLVLSQSADELRATGGFVSAIWLVTLENGELVDVRYHDVVLVDDSARLMLYPRAPLGLENHMNAKVWLLRDVSWEPDFPTTAQTAADMFGIGQRQQVDGVIALNQWTFLSVLEALGSITSPEGGTQITPRNLLTKLEQETDEHGRAYVDLILRGVIDRLNEPVSLYTLMRIASGIHSSLEQRDLLLFVDDPQVQSVIRENGWDGSVRDGNTDYFYVVDSNVGWSKVDRNIERRVTYRVDLSRQLGPRVNLTLRYINHSGPGSPGCEPQWLNRGADYGHLKNACYWNYWRVYTPVGARLLSSTALPLPKYSVAAEIGRSLPGEDTISVSASFSKAVFSGLYALEAGDAIEVSLVYDLPPDVVRRNGDEISYELLIQKQPGARRREVTVEFILPEGFGLASSSVPPASNSASRVAFFLRIDRDTELTAVFTRSDNDPG